MLSLSPKMPSEAQKKCNFVKYSEICIYVRHIRIFWETALGIQFWSDDSQFIIFSSPGHSSHLLLHLISGCKQLKGTVTPKSFLHLYNQKLCIQCGEHDILYVFRVYLKKIVKIIKFSSNLAFCWALRTSSLGFCWALRTSSTDFCWALKPNKNLCYQ